MKIREYAQYKIYTKRSLKVILELPSQKGPYFFKNLFTFIVLISMTFFYVGINLNPNPIR